MRKELTKKLIKGSSQKVFLDSDKYLICDLKAGMNSGLPTKEMEEVKKEHSTYDEARDNAF